MQALKKRILTALLAMGLSLTLPAKAIGPLVVDGQVMEESSYYLYEDTTYVSLRTITTALYPDLTVTWDGVEATVSGDNLMLTAEPGDCYIEVNDRVLYIPEAIHLEKGCTLLPVRVLASALGATVDWNPETGQVTVTSGTGDFPQADQCYDSDDLYWLSRIISAESQGEPLLGKLAVGNVVLNRVDSLVFPDSIYGVIFDDRWGGQFEPVHNGTIYNSPTEESVQAAKMVLEGADVALDSLYFLAPDLTENHWVMENRAYVMTIGCHWFYS